MKEVVESPKTMRILQCLNWQLNSICEVAPMIREQGFQAVRSVHYSH